MRFSDYGFDAFVDVPVIPEDDQWSEGVRGSWRTCDGGVVASLRPTVQFGLDDPRE